MKSNNVHKMNGITRWFPTTRTAVLWQLRPGDPSKVDIGPGELELVAGVATQCIVVHTSRLMQQSGSIKSTCFSVPRPCVPEVSASCICQWLPGSAYDTCIMKKNSCLCNNIRHEVPTSQLDSIAAHPSLIFLLFLLDYTVQRGWLVSHTLAVL